MRIAVRCPGVGVIGLLPFVSTAPTQCTKVSVVLIVITVTCLILLAIIQSHNHPTSAPTTVSRRYPLAIATDTGNPDLHYGVVVDCGSSGTRIYVYVWPTHTGNQHEMLDIQPMRDTQGNLVIKKITPGLSDLADTASRASEYIRPLLDYAHHHIPLDKHKETPLYIMATAGLRMLPESKQRALMEDIQRDLATTTQFLFQDSHAEVITGKQEGVYSWIGINYVLGRFNHQHQMSGTDPLTVVELSGSEHKTHVRKRTVGIIDMGGGSAQIAFEVPNYIKFEPQEESAKNLLTNFNIGCSDLDPDHNYRVYVATFLGFGANAARQKYEQSLASTMNYTRINETLSVSDPCLPLDMPETISHNGHTVTLRGTGQFTECLEKVRPLVNASRGCMKEPCSMNGIFQPEINFDESEFYGFSELYYTTEDVLRMAGPYADTRFQEAAMDYCGTKWETLQRWYSENLYPKADENRFRLQCFKSAWVSTVLHEGLHFPRSYKHLTTAQLVNNREVHWTLGALLYKTRYFPLSEIQQQRYVATHAGHNSGGFLYGVRHIPFYFTFICLAIVLAAIIIYLWRLRIVRTSDLRKIPSMAMFMTEEGQIQDGIVRANYLI